MMTTVCSNYSELNMHLQNYHTTVPTEFDPSRKIVTLYGKIDG